MIEPIKKAFGEYLGRFYASIVPTTKGLETFVKRGLSQSMVFAPSRMIDAAEDMLASWQRNDSNNAPSAPAKMPVVIVALAKDYVPLGRDFTRQVADPVLAIIPADKKERAFQLRSMAGEIRTQLCIFAHDESSARSLAAQFLLFLDASHNRRFNAFYEFADMRLPWPVQIETPETPASSIQTEAKNLTILAIDLTLRASIPLFEAPKLGKPNDGKGVPESNDPAGYPLVTDIHITSQTPDQKIRKYHIKDE